MASKSAGFERRSYEDEELELGSAMVGIFAIQSKKGGVGLAYHLGNRQAGDCWRKAHQDKVLLKSMPLLAWSEKRMKLGDALHSVYIAGPVRQHMKALAWKKYVGDFAEKVKARQHKSPRAQKRPVNAPGAEEYEYAEDDDGDSAGDDGEGDGACDGKPDEEGENSGSTRKQGQNTSPATQTGRLGI
jgi:hypothetical protein